MSSSSPGVPTGNTFDKYATTNPIERRMMDKFIATLDLFVGDAPPARVLEVGLGEGVITRRLQNRFPSVPIVGIDLPDESLAERWQKNDIGSAFADATSLPFPDNAFDLVLAIEVFEHFDDPAAALREMARVCSGRLVASVPLEPIWRIGNIARGRYMGSLGNTPGHVNHWGKRGFRNFVGQGFTIDDVATPFPWTMVSARPVT
ncbi:MAG: SAM-dependent methyltransferase [Ilumatobacter sp.]|jgi:SAM-dependent methyltransferase